MRLFTRGTRATVARTILVVDDEPHVASLISKYLSQAGYGAIEVHDTQAALGEAQARRPDAIVLDVEMPGGWEALERLQAEAETRSIPILLTSHKCINWGDQLPGGVSVYLAKPFPPRVLRRAMTVIFAERKPGRS